VDLFSMIISCRMSGLQVNKIFGIHTTFLPQDLQKFALFPIEEPQCGQTRTGGFSFTTMALPHTVQKPSTIGAPHRGQRGRIGCLVALMGAPQEPQNLAPAFTGLSQAGHASTPVIGIGAASFAPTCAGGWLMVCFTNSHTFPKTPP
jgi:hypothetical protein